MGDFEANGFINGQKRMTWNHVNSSASTHKLRYNLASAGCVQSQISLARSLLDQHETESDRLAVYWLLRASNNDSAEAKEILRDCYLLNRGITQLNKQNVEMCLELQGFDKMAGDISRAIFKAVGDAPDDCTEETVYLSSLTSCLINQDIDAIDSKYDRLVLRDEVTQCIVDALQGRIPDIDLEDIAPKSVGMFSYFPMVTSHLNVFDGFCKDLYESFGNICVSFFCIWFILQQLIPMWTALLTAKVFLALLNSYLILLALSFTYHCAKQATDVKRCNTWLRVCLKYDPTDSARSMASRVYIRNFFETTICAAFVLAVPRYFSSNELLGEPYDSLINNLRFVVAIGVLSAAQGFTRHLSCGYVISSYCIVKYMVWLPPTICDAVVFWMLAALILLRMGFTEVLLYSLAISWFPVAIFSSGDDITITNSVIFVTTSCLLGGRSNVSGMAVGYFALQKCWLPTCIAFVVWLLQLVLRRFRLQTAVKVLVGFALVLATVATSRITFVDPTMPIVEWDEAANQCYARFPRLFNDAPSILQKQECVMTFVGKSVRLEGTVNNIELGDHFNIFQTLRWYAGHEAVFRDLTTGFEAKSLTFLTTNVLLSAGITDVVVWLDERCTNVVNSLNHGDSVVVDEAVVRQLYRIPVMDIVRIRVVREDQADAVCDLSPFKSDVFFVAVQSALSALKSYYY